MSDINFNRLKATLGPEIQLNGQSYLYFGGTAYLGIPQHPVFIQHYIEGIKAYGLNNGTSRSNNVQLGIYEEAESHAAAQFGAEAAIILSSGYLAAQLAVQHYAQWGNVVYAPGSHPALWSNHTNPQITGSFGYWSRHITETINHSTEKRWVLVSNALNNLFPERYDFSFLQEIHQDKEVVLIADDSHGIGILGNGSGCYPDLQQRPHLKILVVASMAKGLGVDAGIILGDQQELSQLKSSNIFLGASPPAAAGLYAFMKSADIYAHELQQLKDNCTYFAAGLGECKSAFAAIKGFPVFLSEDQTLAEKLLKKNVLISSFAYPDQHSPFLNRIVLTSRHRPEAMDFLLNFIRSCD